MPNAISSDNDREFEFTDSDFKFIKKLVFEKTGIQLNDTKRNMIYSRLAKRIRTLKMKSFSEYCTMLSSDTGKEELSDFTNVVTTNLTSFFREGHHFDHLLKASLPEIIRNNRNSKKLRIWSAGCSSGMEAYSIAMTLSEFFPQLRGWDVKILATDIDTNMIKKGDSGIYEVRDSESIPAKYKKFFNKEKKTDKIEISEKLKDLIFFKYMNFIDQWPVKGPFDIIFCRNVVIYFNKDTQKQIFGKFEKVLSKDGYVYIGHSENMNTVTDKFQHIGKTIYKKL